MIARLDGWVGKAAGAWMALAIMLVLALPGFFTVPPVDRDEVLFAQSSAQMLESGQFVDIRFDDQVRYKKPVGIYWLQVVAAKLTGQPGEIWSFRLVSLAGALAAVGFTYAIARQAMPRGPALLAAAALASSFLLGAEARLAKTDAMLLATILAGQYVLARAFLPLGRGQVPQLARAEVLGFWVALAAGVLIKGPIGPMVVGLTLAVLCALRRDAAILRALRPVSGLLLLLALVLPWLVAITIKSDGAFWTKSVGEDMLAKVGSGQERHGAPPGTYLALLWLTFWPGAMLLAAALPAIWRGRRKVLVQFALAWAVPVWLVFELTPTKLVHYVLPAYPALAVLLAWGLWQGAVGRAIWAARMLSLMPLLLLGALAYGAQHYGLSLSWPFWLGGLGLLAAVPVVLIALERGAIGALVPGLAAAGLALSVGFYPTLARMPQLWPAVQIAALQAGHPGCTLSVVGYAEPSVVFLTRRGARFDTAATAAARLSQPGCTVAAVAEAALPDLGRLPDGATPAGRIEGLDLGNGKPVRLQVYIREN